MKVFAILLAFFSLNAWAMSDGEISLQDSVFLAEKPAVDTTFSADADTGRAWIVLNLTHAKGVAIDEFELPGESFKVRIDGLLLDPGTGNIVFHKGGEATVCAIANRRRVFRSVYYKNTRNCKIDVSLDSKTVDDGFALKREPFANVFLNVARR